MMADTDSIQTWFDDEPLSKPPFSDIRDLLHENERLRAAKRPTWSFIRTLLEQGAAIRQDYDAGKFGDSYEAYSARIDEAAREREDTLTALEQKP